MENINEERLKKAKEVNNIFLKIESNKSDQVKHSIQIEKLNTDLWKLYEEMHKINREIYLMSNSHGNNNDEDDYGENSEDIVE